MSRFVKPEVRRLHISKGDWIDVKRRLTAGESHQVLARITPVMVPGEKPHLDTTQVMVAKVLAYLLGWSLTDNGTPVPYNPTINETMRLATLNGLDPDTFTEIKDAIDLHEETEDTIRAAEKNGPDGETGSQPTSPSLASMAGAMTT